MGRLLKVLGAVFLVLLLLFAVLLFWAQRAGSGLQQQFFSAVGSGKTDEVLTLMHPALRAEIDEPVLAAWITAVNARLGPCKGLRKTDFNTSSNRVDGATITESKGTVDFERGTSRSELVFRDGQLVKFLIESDQLGDKWFQGPANTRFYQERGKQLLTHLASGDPAQAHAMMHEALQKAVPLEKLKQNVASLRDKAGALQSVAFEREEFDDKDGQRLKVFYKVQCQKKPLAGMVQFRFIGLKGHVLAFDLAEPDQKPERAGS